MTLRTVARLLAVVLAATVPAVAPAKTDAEPRPPTVRLVTVEGGDGVAVRRFVGRIEALRTVDLSFQLAGLMTRLPVRTGEVVPASELIAALDPADFTLALRRAEARHELAALEHQRAQELLERQATPLARRDEALAQLRLAEVDRDAARRDVSLTEITVPFEALVTRRLVDPFSYVTPETPVVRVQDVSELRAVISVPEDLIALARDPESFTARAFLIALPGDPVALTLSEFVTEADATAQTYEMSFALAEPRHPVILPGMTATVEVRANGRHGDAAPRVPMTAIDTNGEAGFQVWVYDPEAATVAPRPVRLGLATDGAVPVLEGLTGGEIVVAAGVNRLRPGQRVRPLAL